MICINGACFGRLGQPEAGTSVGTHIAPSRITQSCAARLLRAHNDSVPVECPRGPLSMCITIGTYVVCTVNTVFLLLYPCRYMIYGLLLNYDSSTQARLSFYTSWWHTHVAIIQLIHTTYICLAKKNADAKHACLIVKNYNSLTECTFCEHFTWCKMWHASSSSDSGPLANNGKTL